MEDMTHLRSKLLVIGVSPAKLPAWEAQVFPSLRDLKPEAEKLKPDVIICSLTTLSEKSFEIFLQGWKDQKLNPYIIVVGPAEIPREQILSFNKKFRIHRWRESWDSNLVFEDAVLALDLKKSADEQQALKHLIQSENFDLKRLEEELKDKIERRKKYLIKSRRKLFEQSERSEVYRRILLGLQNLTSVTEIETLLNRSLVQAYGFQWIKIAVGPSNEGFVEEVQKKIPSTVHPLSLYEGDQKIGGLFLVGPPLRTLNKDEVVFFQSIAEIVGLALSRIRGEESLKEAQSLWDLSFKSIQQPLTIVSEDYEVFRTNQLGDIKKEKCFELLFKRKTPCKGCRLGHNFNIESAEDFIDVESKVIAKVDLEGLASEKKFFVNLYINKTDDFRRDARKLELERQRDLGLLSGSLAHELNNPLAGLITYLQMIRSDLQSSEDLHGGIQADIALMEEGAKRTKELIQDILRYSRANDQFDPSEVCLKEIREEVLTMSRLLFRGQIFWPLEELDKKKFRGNLGLWSLALRFLIEAVQRLQSENDVSLKSSHSQTDQKLELELHISLNLASKKLERIKEHLSYQLAQQILLDQGARIVFPEASEVIVRWSPY